jgi:hypothetical protein
LPKEGFPELAVMLLSQHSLDWVLNSSPILRAPDPLRSSISMISKRDALWTTGCGNSRIVAQISASNIHAGIPRRELSGNRTTSISDLTPMISSAAPPSSKSG